jgi:hypothetical protein
VGMMMGRRGKEVRGKYRRSSRRRSRCSVHLMDEDRLAPEKLDPGLWVFSQKEDTLMSIRKPATQSLGQRSRVLSGS